MQFEVGHTVGDYEILSVLGFGGMGRVYRVRNLLSDRIEAMKVILPRLTSEAETNSRFMAEIRTLGSFAHPNIAQLRTAFHTEGQLVMVMELVEGVTLADRAKKGRLPQEDILGYVQQLLAALSYAHARGVIHRDVKPSNLMITTDNTMKLMDFGIAKSESRTWMTQPGMTVGSVHYMAPEQMRGAAVDSRADLYSVGVLLYEMLAGRRPFEQNGISSIVHQQLNLEPTPPISHNPRLSKRINDIILLSLMKEPGGRFQSADAFSHALRTAVIRTPQVAPAVRQVPATPRQPRSQRYVGGREPLPARVIPLVARPAILPVIRPVKPERSAPSLIQHAGWMALGAVAVTLVVGAVVEIPRLVNGTDAPGVFATPDTNSSAETEKPSEATAASATTRGIADKSIRAEREKMRQLESRADNANTRLERLKGQPGGDRRGPEAEGDYRRARYDLSSATKNMNNRDIVATRKDLSKAEKEIFLLESVVGR